MPTEFKAFLTTLHNRELDIIDGDYWDDDNQILAAAIAYQLYTQLEQTNSALGFAVNVHLPPLMQLKE